MDIVATTYLALALGILLFVVRRHQQLAVVGFSLPFGAAAAFNLPAFGNSTILVASVVAALFIGLAFVQRRHLLPLMLGAARPYQPGFFLLVFIFIALLITVVAPRMFAQSIEIVSVAREGGLVADSGLVPLRPSTANVTQSLYLVQGILFFLVITALCQAKSKARFVLNGIQGVTVAHLGLAIFDAIENATQLDLLSWLRTANYAYLDDVVFAGLPRLVGGFPEASVFGYFSVALFAFWMVYWRFGGRAKYRFLYMAGSLLATIFSTSSGAYAALGVFGAIMLTLAAMDFARSRAPRPTVVLVVSVLMTAPIAIAAFFIALQVSPGFYSYMDQIAFSKLASESGVERTSWNVYALQAFYDSYFLGIGLGSVRGSSFVVSLLSTVGLLGTLAFFGFLYALATQKAPPHNSEYRALVGAGKAGCLAMFLQANVSASNPDLGLLFFLFAATVYVFADRRVAAAHTAGPPLAQNPNWRPGTVQARQK